MKTLRYYDEIGLLRPGEIDRFTGYRYYSADQLHRLNRILALKIVSQIAIGRAAHQELASGHTHKVYGHAGS